MLAERDRAGRRAAHGRGVSVTGSAGVLVAAKRAGRIGLLRPALDGLVSQGSRLAPRLYRQLLRDAGESPAEPPP